MLLGSVATNRIHQLQLSAIRLTSPGRECGLRVLEPQTRAGFVAHHVMTSAVIPKQLGTS